MNYKVLMISTEQPSGQIKSDDFPYASKEVYLNAFFHVADHTPFTSSEAALVRVAQSYVQTPQGQSVMKENSQRITWEHVFEEIPMSFFEEHGFFQLNEIHRFNTPPTAIEHLTLNRSQVLVFLPY